MISTALTTFSSQLNASQPLACRLFDAALASGNVANAYLLSGRAFDDKLSLARQVACRRNCQKSQQHGFGSCAAAGPAVDQASYCQNCQWILADQHPQAWLTLSGQGKSQKIPVESARHLTEELGKTSSYMRTVVITEADEATFHRPAANALLKCIEEPPPDVLFFFFAESAEQVLATIVSRCQVVPLSAPLTLSHWQPHGLPAEAKEKLDAARANFIVQARRQLGANAPLIRNVDDALSLSRELLELCKQLQDYMEEQQAVEAVIDLFIWCQMEVVRGWAAENKRCAQFVSRLLSLCEITKRQVRQYIKPANAIEAFSLEFTGLRHEYAGDCGIAKG